MASCSVPSVTESPICPVCKDTLQDARVLPCKHQVCAHCLQQHVSASTMTDNRFQCPECRVEWKLSGGGLADMSVIKPSETDAILSKPPVDTSTSSAALCSNSDHGSATVFCPDCDEFYCETCSSNHQSFKLFSGHRMRLVDKVCQGESTQAQSTSRESTCKQHEQEELSTYCKTCRGCICTTCATGEHKDHGHQNLVEAIMETRRELEDMTAKAAMYMVERDDGVEEMMQTKENMTASMKTARDGIKKAAQQARDIINDHEKRVLRDIACHEVKVLTKLEYVRKDHESKKATASLFRQETESLCQSDNVLDMIEQKPLLQEKLNAIRMSTHENITWSFDKSQQIQKSLKVMLGNVKLNSTATLAPGKIALGEPLHQIPLSSNKMVTGLVAMGNCLCITHADDLHLWLYDMDSGYTKKCDDLELKSACGMALLQAVDRTVVIADSQKLHFVKISADLAMTCLRTRDSSGIHQGSITVCRDSGELLISLLQCSNAHVAICNEKGTVLRSILIASQSHPLCVMPAKGGYAVLETTGYIVWVNESGRCLRQYINENGQRIRTYARHMITNKEGQLIFADTATHKVNLVNTNGRLSQFLLTEDDGIENPEYVYLDEDSARLFVVHRPSKSREVCVYNWSPKLGDVLTTNYKLDAQLNKFQYEV